MMRYCLTLLLCCASLAQAALSQQQALEQALQQFVEAGGVPGLTAAFITPQGTHYTSFGYISEEPQRALDERTQFAVASISKLFTTVAVADLVREGKLRFEDTVDQHLPKGIRLPNKDGKTITVAHLATHTSGIPTETDFKRMTVGWKRALKDLYQKPLVTVPGAKFQYNNPGIALLGHVGELVDGRPYEAMVQARVLGPLDMQDTWVKRPAKAPEPLGFFKSGILAPAGGYSSNAVDLAKFAAGALGGAPETLNQAFALSFVPQGKDETGRPLRLGWHEGTEAQQLNHTGRNNIYVGIDPKRKVAMVILCTDQTLQIGALGQAALATLGGGKGQWPKPSKIVKLSAEELQPYVGEYQYQKAGKVQLKADAGRGVLLLAFDGKGETVLWADQDRGFRCKEWHCDLAFAPTVDGKAPKVTITMDNWAGDYVRVAGELR